MKKIICLLFVLTGCAAEPFTINVDALSLSEKSLDKYNNCYVTTKNKNIDVQTLQFKEYLAYIEMALEENKIKVMADKNKASCLVYVDYGISEPKKTQHTSTAPQLGVTGYSPNYVYDSWNDGFYTRGARYNPVYGVVGYNEISYTSISYETYLLLDAREKNSNEQLWSVLVQSEGESDDLRYVFPYLTAVAADNIKTSTNTKELYIVEIDDEKVKTYKNKGKINE